VIGTLLLMATVLLGEAVLLAVTVRLVGALRVVAVGGRADEADAEVVGGTSGCAIEAVAACVVDRGSVSTEGVALVCAALAAGSAFERGLGRLVVELVAMVRTGRAERVTAAPAALLGAAVGALDRVRAGTVIGGADAVDGSASVDGSARVVDAAGVEEGATWAALEDAIGRADGNRTMAPTTATVAAADNASFFVTAVTLTPDTPTGGRNRPRTRAPVRQSSLLPPDSPEVIKPMTAVSCSVVTSPSSRFSATSRSSRRMILPDRVLGSSGTIMIWRGRAIGPIWDATCLRNSATSSAPASAPPPVTRAVASPAE